MKKTSIKSKRARRTAGSVERTVRALAAQWQEIATELEAEQDAMPFSVQQARSAEIRVCRLHASQIEKLLR